VADSEDASDSREISPKRAKGVKKVLSSIRTALSGGEGGKSPERPGTQRLVGLYPF
jgi:hypothetical protein